MGAINYKSNKYVTLGVNTEKILNDFEELEEDTLEFYDEITDYFMECEFILSKYNFEYFEVTLKDGYYDGFYLEIKDKDYVYFDDTTEKNEVLKETTKLKKLLLELVDNGLVVCFPWWVTKYLDAKGSKEEVKKAIKEIKKDIQNIPTYRNYKKAN